MHSNAMDFSIIFSEKLPNLNTTIWETTYIKRPAKEGKCLSMIVYSQFKYEMFWIPCNKTHPLVTVICESKRKQRFLPNTTIPEPKEYCPHLVDIMIESFCH